MWRTLIVTSGEKMTVRDGWLHVYSPQQEARVPIGDLYSVVVDNRQTLLSMGVLTQLAQAGVHVLLCDEKHLPCAELLPLSQHYRPLTVLQKQMDLSQSFKDLLWQRIITAKIQNQAKTLRLVGANRSKAQKLEELALTVSAGDRGNREAQAAKLYFPALFGAGFTRTMDDVTNDALNYGYAIIRSAVSKTLAGYGYSGVLGLHHIGPGNPFNLADDLMEPLRPLVDLWVDDHCDDLYEELTRTNRRELIGLVNHIIWLDGKKMRVRYAIDRYIKSLTSAIEGKDAGLLLLPELIRNDPAFEDEQDG